MHTTVLVLICWSIEEYVCPRAIIKLDVMHNHWKLLCYHVSILERKCLRRTESANWNFCCDVVPIGPPEDWSSGASTLCWFWKDWREETKKLCPYSPCPTLNNANDLLVNCIRAPVMWYVDMHALAKAAHRVFPPYFLFGFLKKSNIHDS